MVCTGSWGDNILNWIFILMQLPSLKQGRTWGVCMACMYVCMCVHIYSFFLHIFFYLRIEVFILNKNAS